MHRIVATCFKAIAFAIIFVMVWDVGFYLWRANALNQRMEAIAVSMQEVISKNNYLPEGDAKLFNSILTQIQTDMNVSDTFINAMDWNYKDNATANLSNMNFGTNKLRLQMGTPAAYGDVMVLELRVNINATVWTQVGGSVAGGENGADTFVNNTTGTTFTYTYLIPCLKYTTVTN